MKCETCIWLIVINNQQALCPFLQCVKDNDGKLIREEVTMEFIKLTRNINNEQVFVKASAVIGVIQKQGMTKIFVNNDIIPYEVKETAQDVITLINDMEDKKAMDAQKELVEQECNMDKLKDTLLLVAKNVSDLGITKEEFNNMWKIASMSNA